MSGSSILDGTGNGNRAEVDSDKKLNTRAVVKTELGHQASTGNSYVCYAKHSIVTASTNEGLFVIENKGTGDMVVEQVTFSTKCTTAMKIELFFDPVMTVEGTELTPMNLNRGSKKQSGAHIHDNRADDMAYTIDGDLEFLDIRLTPGAPTFTYGFNDGLILAPGTSMFAQVEGDTIGDKVRANLYFYEMSSGGHGGH